MMNRPQRIPMAQFAMGIFMSLCMGLMEGGHVLAAPAPSSPTTAQASPARPGFMRMTLRDVYHQMVAFIKAEERLLTADIDSFKSDIRQDTRYFESLVEEAGFQLVDTAMGVSLFPSVTLTFDYDRTLTPEEKAALVKKLEQENLVTRWIVNTLLDAVESPAAQRKDGYRLWEVDVDLDIIPNVTLHVTNSQ